MNHRSEIEPLNNSNVVVVNLFDVRSEAVVAVGSITVGQLYQLNNGEGEVEL